MNLSGFSFFEHEDFKFAKSEVDELSMRTVEQNLVKIDIWNENMYLGGSVRGIVRILIPKNLKPGQVMLKLETSLTSKVRSKVNPVSITSIIDNYKQCIEPIKAPRPLKRTFTSNLREITTFMKMSAVKINNISSVQKLKRLMRRGRRIGSSQTNNDSPFAQDSARDKIATNRSGANTGRSISYNKRVNRDMLRQEVEKSRRRELRRQEKRKLSRKQSQKSKSSKKIKIDESEKINTVNGDDLNSIHPEMDKIYSETTAIIFSKDMKLFTLREYVKERSILVIPFEMKIPIGFPTSCKKDIDLQNQISLIFKRNNLLNPNNHVQKDNNDKPAQSKANNGEFIQLNHKLVAYFISLEEIREIKRQEKENASDSKTINLNSHIPKNGLMSCQSTFNVYQKMNQTDFLKTSSVASIKVLGGTLENSKSTFCKCLRGWKIFQSMDFNIEISIDRTVFRTSDNTINMVIKYKNEIMTKYDYIDLILISRTTITDFEDLQSRNKSIAGDSVFMNLANQQFRAFSERDFMAKPGISIVKPPEEQKEKKKQEHWDIIPRRMRSNNERYLNKGNGLDPYLGISDNLEPYGTKRSMDSQKVSSGGRKRRKSSKLSGNTLGLGGDNGLSKMKNYIKRSISKTSDKGNHLIQQALKNARNERVKVDKNDLKEAETRPRIETLRQIPTMPVNKKSTFNSNGTDLSDKGTAVDQILYAQSLDLIGKRDIGEEMMGESTELVHRIQLEQIKSDLQTVKTDFITITYHLQLYLSVGPLGFQKRIRKVNLTFINTSKDTMFGKRLMCKRLKSLIRTSQDLEQVMILPYSKVNPEEDIFVL